MSTISPAQIGAGLACSAVFAFAFLVTTSQPPPKISFAMAAADTTPDAGTLPDLYREDRLAPNPLPDDGTNGCGLPKEADICSLEFVQTHMPHYLQPSYE